MHGDTMYIIKIGQLLLCLKYNVDIIYIYIVSRIYVRLKREPSVAVLSLNVRHNFPKLPVVDIYTSSNASLEDALFSGISIIIIVITYSKNCILINSLVDNLHNNKNGEKIEKNNDTIIIMIWKEKLVLKY